MRTRRSTTERRGFSLVELMIVVAIMSVLATIIGLALFPVRQKARDSKRKSDIAQMGRFFQIACFKPAGGGGDYDIADIWDQLKASNPQYANAIPNAPKDPKGGTAEETKYRYVVTGDAKKCALYANLERTDERVTLEHLTAPTPGGGNGVFRASADGPNGGPLYIQASN